MDKLEEGNSISNKLVSFVCFLTQSTWKRASVHQQSSLKISSENCSHFSAIFAWEFYIFTTFLIVARLKHQNYGKFPCYALFFVWYTQRIYKSEALLHKTCFVQWQLISKNSFVQLNFIEQNLICAMSLPIKEALKKKNQQWVLKQIKIVEPCCWGYSMISLGGLIAQNPCMRTSAMPQLHKFFSDCTMYLHKFQMLIAHEICVKIILLIKIAF